MKFKCNPYSEINDDEILELIQNANDKGYELLYKKYWDLLVDFVLRYIGSSDDAKEIAQNQLISLFEKGQFPRNGRSLLPFLKSSLYHRILNYFRDKKTYRKCVIDCTNHGRNFTENNYCSLDYFALRKEIRRILTKLPPQFGDVCLLKLENALSVSEISNQLNRPTATVDKQIRKATRFLNDHLKVDIV